MNLKQEANDLIDLAKEDGKCQVPGCLRDSTDWGLLCTKHDQEMVEDFERVGCNHNWWFRDNPEDRTKQQCVCYYCGFAKNVCD